MMSKSKWEMWKQKNDNATFWDFLNPNIEKVSLEVSKQRLDICISCDKLIISTKQCKICKCFMTAKTKLPHASCPIGKWGKVDAID